MAARRATPVEGACLGLVLASDQTRGAFRIEAFVRREAAYELYVMHTMQEPFIHRSAARH
jgi:hypothetical protein